MQPSNNNLIRGREQTLASPSYPVTFNSRRRKIKILPRVHSLAAAKASCAKVGMKLIGTEQYVSSLMAYKATLPYLGHTKNESGGAGYYTWIDDSEANIGPPDIVLGMRDGNGSDIDALIISQTISTLTNALKAKQVPQAKIEQVKQLIADIKLGLEPLCY